LRCGGPDRTGHGRGEFLQEELAPLSMMDREAESESASLLVSMYTEADEKAGDGTKRSRGLDTASDSMVSDIDKDDVYSLSEQKAIIHRIDRRLVVTCGLIYCFSLIDRGNLGNASIAG